MTHISRKTRSTGFTLIELLVVIAIIGILSAVILAALSTARGKGNDAAVQSDLSTITTQAELYYSGAGANTYGAVTALCTAGMFSGDTTITNALAGAKNDARGNVVQCGSSGQTYAVIAQINGTTTNTDWCVDSAGNRKYEYIASPVSVTACP